jgi:peptidoglycan/xylan/chitin deacetylase (PgdA/CDA1 family)
VHLTKVSPEEAKRQIIESKKILEQKLGENVQYFCYPYGEYNQAVAEMVKESGYKAATTTKLGLTNSPFDRIRITGYFNNQRFMKELHSY